MQEFGKFLAQYWQIILASILTIISAIIALFRKKPVSSVISDIYQLVVKAVNAVESEGILGSEQKKAVATAQVVNGLKALYPSFESKKYITYIHQVIEDVLTTPQKKGDF